MVELGRNARCWCDSGKKYKHCHLEREKKKPIELKDVLKDLRNAMSIKQCLAAGLDSIPCSKKIVKAHSLSKEASLARIARGGHVYGFYELSKPDEKGETLAVAKKGIHQASTFTGFCEKHDGLLFRPIDSQDMLPTDEQAALLSYRGLCRELHFKAAMQRTIPGLRKIDLGRSKVRQQFVQETANMLQKHVAATLPQLMEEQKQWHDMISRKEYQQISYAYVRFDSVPGILCAGVTQPDRDFSNRELMNLQTANTRQDNVAFSLIPTDTGGLALFGWIGIYKEAEALVDSLFQLDRARIPSRLISFAFETFDNICMAPDWWDSLPNEMQTFLVQRMNRGNIVFGDGYNLADNGMVLANWNIIEMNRVFRPDKK